MASTMKICSECRRHLLAPEPQCPFCGAALPMATAPAGRRRCQGVMLGLTIALGSVGCGPGTDDPLDPSTSSESGETSQTTTAASTGTMLPGSGSGDVSTGSDSTTQGESSSDDGDDAGGGFYAGPDPDVGEAFPCDQFLQDCPEGEKCMPWANDGSSAWNATRCTPIDDDPAQADEPCTVEGNGVSGIDSCDLGLMCWDVDPKTNEGECVPQCTGSLAAPTCDDPDRVCAIANDGVLSICLPSCDPVLQDCEDGYGCYPRFGDFLCAPVAAESSHGDVCEFINTCSAGQVCLSSEVDPDCPGLGCCAEVCSTDDPDADMNCAMTAPMHGCVPFFEEGMAPIGLDHVGVCAEGPI